MPLTALNEGGDLLDATCLVDGVWSVIYRSRPRSDLRCRDCGQRMHAKVSSDGLKFFAHDRGAADCPGVGESADHRRLKLLLAQVIRDQGCDAEVEALPGPADEGGWRADVLGRSPAGVRVAFEVQLAAMTVGDGQFRTARYASDGIGCLWLSPRHASWMTRIPSCRLVIGGDELVVDRGLARFETGRWVPAGTVPLWRVIRGLLADSIVPVQAERGLGEMVGGHDCWIDSPVILAGRGDVDREREFSAAAAREAEARQRAREQHAINQAAWAERQHRTSQYALRTLVDSGVTASRVRIGTPGFGWNGQFPVRLPASAGSERTAFGAAIWVDGDLWGVVCPVASRCSPGLGTSWHRRAVRVFVADHHEAAQVGAALQWPVSQLAVPAPDTVPAAGDAKRADGPQTARGGALSPDGWSDGPFAGQPR